MEENKKQTEKDKKYHIILGVMLFLFIIFVGICIAFGLGVIGTNSNESNTIDKEQENIAIDDDNKENIINEETNNTNENVESTTPTNPNLDENKNTNSTTQENTTVNTNTATNTNSQVANQNNSSSTNTTSKVEPENTEDDISKELDNMSEILGNQLLQAYNNKVLTGTQVKSAVMQYLGSEDMTIVLMNSDGSRIIATAGAKKISQGSVIAKNGYYEITSDKYSTEGGTMHKTSMDDFNNAENEAYISVVKRYNAYLLTLSGTTDVVGIVFVG